MPRRLFSPARWGRPQGGLERTRSGGVSAFRVARIAQRAARSGPDAHPLRVLEEGAACLPGTRTFVLQDVREHETRGARFSRRQANRPRNPSLRSGTLRAVPPDLVHGKAGKHLTRHLTPVRTKETSAMTQSMQAHPAGKGVHDQEFALLELVKWSARVDVARQAYEESLLECERLRIPNTTIARRLGKSEAAIRMYLLRKKKRV